MEGPPGIVRRKSILAKMLAHNLLCFPFLISTIFAWTPQDTGSFSLTPCPFQKIVGLSNPFIGHGSLTWTARVHPLTVIHLLDGSEYNKNQMHLRVVPTF